MGAENSAFGIYAIATSVIALHLFALALYTGRVRNRHKQWINAEDAGFFKRDVSESEHPDVLRVKRAHANALENAVPFFAVAAVYASTAPSKNGALAYFGVFVAARLLHSIAYIWGKQPFRTILFAVGVLAVIGMAVHVIRYYA
jgi:glutathione S-transferase